jgi:FkbM family methyltransferase
MPAAGATVKELNINYASSGPTPDADAPAPVFEYPKEPIISYAQTREDVLLWRALHNVHCGFYIDVGAHDPTALSVTRAFYDRGWRGINVEPNPSYAAKLRQERPRDVTREVALGDSAGSATLYEFGDTGLSTLVKEIAEGHITAGFKATERRVPLTTLAELLNDLGEQTVHFLKIDVEGFELQVLRGADFKRVRPWIVLIEAVKPMTTISNYGSSEALLLEEGYDFAYFDGLNRFYVAAEHRDLKRYFSVPVSICDPFRDSEVVRLSAVIADLQRDEAQQASELAHLSGVLSALQRDRMKHEVPRLGNSPNTPIACDAHDAAGLLRIVEAQASDLVRLRRALMSSQTVAAQRLRIILTEESETGKLYEPPRSIVLREINRAQDAISDVIEHSRWRRIGQHLGLAKQLAWETGDWRSKLTQGEFADGTARRPSIAELLTELERLTELLDQFRLSRWRKLGHRLGLAKRLPWESGEWRDPRLTKISQSDDGEGWSGAEVKAETSHSSYWGFVEYTNHRFLEECRGYAADVILDIGANTGQFAQGLRANGYLGHIISFEPLSDAHATLVATAASDPLWDVAERCAVGASDTRGDINIAGNSYSSSLLPMLDLHRQAAPESAYQGTEPCRIITLDSYIEQTFSDPTTTFGLKIDTQGYEKQVLAGLKRNHDRVKVIVCEMSLAPLYADGPGMSELCHLLAELGYRCVALGPEFEDPRTGELLQANGVFVKRG